jgi:hypothetical protein
VCPINSTNGVVEVRIEPRRIKEIRDVKEQTYLELDWVASGGGAGGTGRSPAREFDGEQFPGDARGWPASWELGARVGAGFNESVPGVRSSRPRDLITPAGGGRRHRSPEIERRRPGGRWRLGTNPN